MLAALHTVRVDLCNNKLNSRHTRIFFQSAQDVVVDVDQPTGLRILFFSDVVFEQIW